MKILRLTKYDDFFYNLKVKFNTKNVYSSEKKEDILRKFSFCKMYLFLYNMNESSTMLGIFLI